MAVAPLVMMGASALGSYLGNRKKKKAEAEAAAQQQAAQPAETQVGAPAAPAAASQTTSGATKQANLVQLRARKRAAAGNSGIVTPRGGIGGGSGGVMGTVRTLIGG